MGMGMLPSCTLYSFVHFWDAEKGRGSPQGMVMDRDGMGMDAVHSQPPVNLPSFPSPFSAVHVRVYVEVVYGCIYGEHACACYDTRGAGR